MKTDINISDETREVLHSMIDWRCMKVVSILAAIVSAITLPSISYAYFSDKSHTEDIIVKMDKKMDILLSMQSQVVLNTNEIVEIKKCQDNIKKDIKSIFIRKN